MTVQTNSYKGTRDFYPEDMAIQNYIYKVWRKTVINFGYQEYNTPLIEPLELYKSKTSEEIINDQIYSFIDRGGREVALRPEMTPSVSRIVASKNQELGFPLRLFSIPDVWRYERPQKGRLRQHWQLNVDLFGSNEIWAEFEIIDLANTIMKNFGANDSMYKIFINSRELLNYILEENLRLNKNDSINTIRIIDKVKKINESELFDLLLKIMTKEKAKFLVDVLKTNKLTDLPKEIIEQESYQKLMKVHKTLIKSGVSNIGIDLSLARGFDYYSGIVFEMFDTNSDNNRSLFGGGRYDSLMDIFGTEKIPSVGFGMGDVTIKDFLTTHNLLPETKSKINTYVAIVGEIYEEAYPVINMLREREIDIAVDFTDKKIDKKIKNAKKLGAKYIIFIGEEELERKILTIKNIHSSSLVKVSFDNINKDYFV